MKYLKEYLKLELNKVVDYDRFNQYAIVHHSSAMEGSTLTLEETNVLLNNGLTPKGKPLEHTLMVKDHYEALLYAIELGRNKVMLTRDLLHELNARVMKNTGAIRNNVLGTIDETKGEFRNANVRAGGTTFINYDKVPGRVGELIKSVNDNITLKNTEQQLKLAFYAQFELLTIHPFFDGNGRTSRLLMNYLQSYFKLPLAIVYTEDKVKYIEALKETREKKDLTVFYAFMFNQYDKYLSEEIKQHKSGIGNNFKLGLLM